MEWLDSLALHLAVGAIAMLLSIPLYLLGGKLGTIVLMYSPVIASLALWAVRIPRKASIRTRSGEKEGIYLGRSGRMLVFDFGMLHEDEVLEVAFGRKNEKSMDSGLQEYSH